MKKVLLGIFTLVLSMEAFSQNCEAAYMKYRENPSYKSKDYGRALPDWTPAFGTIGTCKNSDVVANILLDGERILPLAISEASDQTQKVADLKLLDNLYNEKIKRNPENTNYYKAQIIYYNCTNGNGTDQEFYNQYHDLFKTDAASLPSQAMMDYYYRAQVLLSNQTITYDDMIDTYESIKRALDSNIERSNSEIEMLENLKDSVGLTKTEQAQLDNKTRNRASYEYTYNYVEENAAFLNTCEQMVPKFKADFEKMKMDYDWLEQVRGTLFNLDCQNDMAFYEQIETQFESVYNEKICKESPEKCQAVASAQGTKTTTTTVKVSNDYTKGMKAYASRNYSQAASLLNSVSGNGDFTSKQRSDAAYISAVSYTKIGNHSKAISMAKEAASLRSGWGEPYLIMAQAYAAGANSCGNTKFEKKSAYWFAADIASKAKRVDPRVGKKADTLIASYIKNAPSKAEAFSDGKSEGQAVNTCYGKTTARF